MNPPEGFKKPSAIKGGIVMGAIVMFVIIIIMAVAAVPSAQDKRAVEIEKCLIIIKTTQDVLDAIKILDRNYNLAEIQYKNKDYGKWHKMTPDTMPENMKELYEKRLEGAEMVRSNYKLMDKYNCW